MTSSPPDRPNPLVPGFWLDRYELLWPVADGGMASVWVARLARKHGFEKIVAIKTILPKLAADDRFQKMFLDEGRIASRIDHVNVAQILDLGEENDVFYLVMEWIDGDSLSRLQRAVAKKGELIPLPIVLRILADTCHGLHAAHELRGPDNALLGVVHRDISPQNVLVTVGGVAKLIDFGIAKAKNRLVADTNAGLLKGKVHFMAPEQALGRTVDRRSDIWAVGAMAYQMLAGCAPFEGENELETLHKLGSGAPPPPLPGTVPAIVSAVILRALAHTPDDRWATAAEMRAALETAMRDNNLVASTSDVAAFIQLHLADRAAARRRAIENATQAANARAQAPYDPNRQEPGASTEIMAISAPSPGWPSQMTPSGASPVPSASGSGAFPARIEVDIASAGGGSLGLGSVATSVPVPARKVSRAIVFLLVGACLLAVVGGVLIATSLRAKAVAARPTAPPSAAAANEPPPPVASAEPVTTTPSESSAAIEFPAPSATATTTATTAAPASATRPIARAPAVAVAPRVAPPPAPPIKKPKRVDDGF